MKFDLNVWNVMKNKQKTPQRNLRRFALWGAGKRTFRFTRRNTSFCFFGTLRFADYTSLTHHTLLHIFYPVFRHSTVSCTARRTLSPPSRRTDREQAYRYRLSATSIFPLGNNFTLQAGKMLSLLLMKSSGNRRNSPLYFKQALSAFQLTPDCSSSKAYLHVR